MAKQTLSLKRNFSWSVVGNVLYSFAQWLVLILITRLCGTSAVGLFGFALALSAPFFAFFNFSVRDLYVTDVHSERAHSYFQLRVLTSLVASFVIVSLGAVVCENIHEWSVLFFVVLVKFVETQSDIFEAVFQKSERMDRIACLQIGNGFMSVVGIGLVLWFTESLLAGLAVLCLVRLVTLAMNARWLFSSEGIALKELYGNSWNYSECYRLMRESAPLGVRRLLVAFNTNAPRYILEAFYGMNALGIYTAISYFMYAGVTLCEALSASSATRLAYAYKESAAAFRRLLFMLLLFALTIGLGGIAVAVFAGDDLLPLIYGQEFAGQTLVFVLFMCAAAGMYLYGYLNVAMTVMRQMRLQGWIAVGALSVNCVISWILVQQYQAVGAAMGTLSGSAVFLLSSLYFVRVAVRKMPCTGNVEQ